MGILVTGGAGFIGSHLVDYLLQKNKKVTVLDDFSGPSKTLFPAHMDNPLLDFIQGSVLDQDLVLELMQSTTELYHLAATVGVSRINDDPIKAIEVNIRGSEIVLSSAAECRVRTMLLSSSEIYGRNPNMPLHEESDRVLGSPAISRWTYSEAKAIDEFYAFELNKKSGFEVTIARLFNTVGPRQSGNYGMVLPRFIESAITNKPLIVYGDGSQTRSFCSVFDVVEALGRLIKLPESIGQAYNIGSANEISIKDLAIKVIELTESRSQIEFKKQSEVFGLSFDEPVRRVPDISKITNATGWKPKKCLDEIILEVADYFKANGI